MAGFFDGVISELETALNRTSLKQKTISQNIANVNTPNYKVKRVDFRGELERQLEAYRTDPRHIPFSTSTEAKAYIRTEDDTAFNNNGNNVDIDREMSMLAANQIQYHALVSKLNGSFRKLDSVLRGGQ